MGRHSLRRYADRLALHVALVGLTTYLIRKVVFGDSGGGLAVLGIVFVLALIASWVLRRVSGMTWREALWPHGEPPPSTMPPPSLASVNELARTGKKLQAVKMYRELTGVDIRAGVEAVEAMVAQGNVDEPARRIDPHR